MIFMDYSFTSTVIFESFSHLYNQMHKYLEYSKEDLDLIRKCTLIHKRSQSQKLRKETRSKTIESDRKDENLQGTRKFQKTQIGHGKLDDMSTLKKKGEKKKNLIQQVSQFTILEQRSEESSLFKSQNLKQKASQSKTDRFTPTKTQKQVFERIQQLKGRLQYRLYVNSRALMKKPAYGKYITCKFTQLKE